MYKAIIFDFFGVIHSDPSARWFKKHSIERQGAFAEVFNLLDGGHITQTELYERLARLSSQPASSIKDIFDREEVIDADLINLINHLRESFKTALLSNSRAEYLKPLLKKYDLEKYFDEIIISSEVGYIKPSRDIFEFALKKLDSTPEETIFIDDSNHNIAGASELGIKALTFTNYEKLVVDLRELGIQA